MLMNIYRKSWDTELWVYIYIYIYIGAIEILILYKAK